MDAVDIHTTDQALAFVGVGASDADATGAQDLRCLGSVVIREGERLNCLVGGGTAIYNPGRRREPAGPQTWLERWYADDLLGTEPNVTAVEMESDDIAAIKELFGRYALEGLRRLTVVSDFSAVMLERAAPPTTAPGDDVEVTDEKPSPAYDAFKDLVEWLDATDDEVASMVGVGRTTPYDWKRAGREPRRSTVRLLFQCHAILSALVKKLGEPRAKAWLLVEDPERRERLLRGDIAAIQTETRPIIFGVARPRTRPGSWMPDDRSDDSAEE